METKYKTVDNQFMRLLAEHHLYISVLLPEKNKNFFFFF